MDSAPQQERNFGGAAESLDLAGLGFVEICLLLIRVNSRNPQACVSRTPRQPRHRPHHDEAGAARTSATPADPHDTVARYGQRGTATGHRSGSGAGALDWPPGPPYE